MRVSRGLQQGWLRRHRDGTDGVSGGTFDPTTLPLELYVRGSFSASPWTGTASTGGSGGRDMTEAVTPFTTGTALNGYTPAKTDGTHDRMSNLNNLSVFINTTDYFGWALFNCATATNNVDGYASDAISADSGGYQGVCVYDNGTKKVQAWHYDGAVKGFAHTVTYSAWHLICFRYDGTNIRSKVDSGTVQVAAAGSVQSVASTTMRLGINFGLTRKYDGQIMEVALGKGAQSDATFDNIKTYVNARYALSL